MTEPTGTAETASPLREKIIESLRSVHDPEIPVNIYDLGLIYDLDVADDGGVRIRMTLTTPNCPVAESMPTLVRRQVESVEGVMSVDVELVWDPPWSGDMMTEDARMLLDMMGISWSDPHASAGRRLTSLTLGKTAKRSGEERKRK